MSIVGRYWFPITSMVVNAVCLTLYFRGQAFDLGIHQLIIRLLVTFFIGLSIDAGTVRLALQRIRYQIFLQSWIFLVFPIVILLISVFLSLLISSVTTIHLLTWNTYLALLAVSVLPTTISSCVVFTRNSGGNPALSLVGCTTSNFLGIIISPVVFMLLSGKLGELILILPLLGEIVLTVVLPVFCGQVVRSILLLVRKAGVERFTKVTMLFCNILVLLNVISAVGRVQKGIAFVDALPVFLLFAVAYVILLFITHLVLQRVGIQRGEAIAFLFTGNQKTLTYGLPLLSVFFNQDPEIHAYSLVMLLALMLWQFGVAGFVQFMYQYTSTRISNRG